LVFYTWQFFVNKLPLNLIISLFIITIPTLIVSTLIKNSAKEFVNEVILLIIAVLTVSYVDIYVFITLTTILIFINSLKNNKHLYLITALLIFLFSFYKTGFYEYLIIQITAYLSYLFNSLIIKKKEVSGLEYILDDINENVVKFCNFIINFSDSNHSTSHEKKVSEGIRILIENYCAKCKNKTICYGEKKTKTYIFLKEALTKNSQANSATNSKDFFNCIYYSNVKEKAFALQKQYCLNENVDLTDYKLQGVCYSIQNYFISLFEKTSPAILNILNFQKHLTNKNIKYDNFHHSILTENKFQLKIYSKKYDDLVEILNEANNYFKNNDICCEIKDDYVSIRKRKNFKVIYDSATLSYNNCQISGDNLLFKNINDINFICALSDGMGSGYSAYQLSQQTLKMVDQITDCSIDFDTSLEILNNFFKTKDALESYATLDFVDIDLNSGLLNLYKLGSSTTYISRGNKIVPIYNNNLPFGISDLIIKEQYKLEDDDLIILVSDGITDYINETVLINFIETLKSESPHKIVYEILQKIYYDNNKKSLDDMSCLVLKIKSI
jgi:stage II sporulation protein E